MLRKPLAFCILLIVVGCSSPESKKTADEVNVKTEEPVEERNLYGEYESYIASLDSTNEQSVTLAAEKYAGLFSKSEEQLCDSAFVLFHGMYEKVERNLNNTVFPASDLEELPCASYDENGKELPRDKRLTAIEKRMRKHGFRLECWEGYPGIGSDRAFISSHFYQYVSPVMKSFLEALRKELDSEIGVDAGISISEEDYVDRLVWWEAFNREHPDFILSRKSKSYQIYLFTYFLTGMDNTPAINYETAENGTEKMVLDAYFVKAYAYLDKKYPASPVNAWVKPYKMTILKNDNAKRERMIQTYTKRGLMIDYSKGFDLEF